VETETPQNKRRRNQKEKQAKERKSKRICIPIDKASYEQIIEDSKEFRRYIDMCQMQCTELFPEKFSEGYKCIGFCEQSKKMPELKIRRINMKHDGETYQVVPSFVMPYMTGYVEDVEKALFLHFKYEVPFDGLVYVFGKDVSYWYRLCQQLGRYSIA